MKEPVYVTDKRYIRGRLYVRFSNGHLKSYDAIELGCEWLQMSNDAFYKLYGFNFNPHEYGIYNTCRRRLYGRD